jgi:hypothetical protein
MKKITRAGALLSLMLLCYAQTFAYVLTRFDQSWCTPTFPTAFVAGSFTIAESTVGEFKKGQTNKTIIFDAPAGFAFNTTGGSFSVSRVGTTDITAISIASTSATRFTVTVTTPNVAQVELNSITVACQVQATAAGILSKIIRNGGTFRIANSTVKPTAAQSLGNLLAEQTMTYSSSTVAQPNTQGTTDNDIVQVQVVVTGTCTPFSLTQLSFNTDGGNGTGTNNPLTNVSAARVYYTGTVNSFSPANLFGSLTSPNGAFTLNGSQVLSAGTNYFWLVYDLKPTATPGDRLDAQCSSMVISGGVGTKVPTLLNPVGSRLISALTSYYSLGTGNWTNTANWSNTSGGVACGCEPNGVGNVFIQPGHTVTLDATRTVDFLSIENGALLQDNGVSTLTVVNNMSVDLTGRFAATSNWTVNGYAALTGSGASTTSANFSVLGNLTLDGTSLTETGTGTISAKANILLDGTLSTGAAGGAIALNGASAQIISSSITGVFGGTGTVTFSGTNKTVSTASAISSSSIFAISGAITVTNNGTVSMTSDITGSVAGSTWNNAAGSLLQTTGTILSTGTLTATASTNTVEYNGTGVQTIKLTTYDKLALTVGGTKNFAAGTTIVNTNLLISGSAIADAATNTVNGTGGLTMTGTSEFRLAKLASTLPELTGAYDLSGGTVTLNPAAATTDIARAATYYNLKLDGAAGSIFNLAAVTDVLNDLEVTNQSAMTSNGILFVSGNLLYSSSGTSILSNDVDVSGTLGCVFSGSGAFNMNAKNLFTSRLSQSGSTIGQNANTQTSSIEVNVGDWTRTGGTFTASAATNRFINVTFIGTAAQQIGGSVSTTFNNLIINNAAGVTLAQPATVVGILTLTTGILTTSTANLLSVTNTVAGAVVGGSTTAHVSGPLRWSLGASTYIFPIGKGGGYYPMTLNSVTGTAPVVDAEVFNVGSGGTPGAGLASLSTTEYWLASVSSGALSNATVSLTRPAALGTLNAISRSATLTGVYNTLGGTVAGTSINNSTATGTTLDYFAFAVTGAAATITTGTVSPVSFCAGSSLNIPYTITGTFTAGNIFTAELSDASGSFAVPVSIGTLASTTAGSVTATIPGGTVAGTGYRIRVTGSTPAIVGTDNGTDISISVAPTASAAGSAQTICATGTATLAANSPTVGTGAWSVVSGPSTASTQFSSTTSNTAVFDPAAGAGSYVLAWTISNAPCTASASNVTITVTAAPTTSVAGTNQTICNGGAATLAANSPTVGTGAWSVISGPSTASTQFSSTTSNTATFTPAAGAGSYVLAWTISNAPCTASASNVTVTVTAAPTASVAGSAQTICATGTATLAANSPTVGTGAWSVVSGPSTASTQFSSTTSNTAVFDPAGGAGSYVLAWTISNAPCTASASNVTITVTAAPTASVAGTNQTICNGGAATLAANSPTVGTGAWSVVSGPSTSSTQFSSTTSNTATFTPAAGAGSYVLAWTISNAPCTASASNVTVTVTAAPTASAAGSAQTICATGTATLAANSPTVGTGAWSVVSGPSTASTQFSSTTSNTAVFDPAAGAGSYVLAWTISNAPCTASASNVTITVTAAPTASVAGTNQTICNGGAATLAANSPTVGTGAWSVISGPSTSSTQFSSTTSNTATFTPAAGAGSYVLAWTISNAPCTASASNVTVTVTAAPTVSAAGSAQTICATGTATLAANSPTIGTGAWSVVSGPSTASTQFSSTTSNTAVFDPAGGAGSYVLAWTISNAPCTASASNVTITVTAAPTTSIAGTNQTICATSTATLAANSPTVGTGAWSVVSGPSTASTQFSSTTSNTATFTPAAGAGSYVLAWTISNAPCTASASNLTITVNGTPTVSSAGTNQTICSSSSATLAANSPTVGTGVWSVVSGPSTASTQFSSTTSNTAAFSPIGGAGTYILRWTISNSPCTASTSDVTITVSGGPSTSAAGANQTICVTGTATLAANSPTVGTGAWSVLSGPSTASTQFSSTTSNTAIFDPAGGSGAYILRWTITDVSCVPSTDDVTITVTSAPSASVAGSAQTICATSTATLAANSPTVGTGAWSVVSGPSTASTQFSSTTSNTATFTPAAGAGSYVLSWTISNAPCTASASNVTITVTAAPTTSVAGTNQTICATSTATLAANSPTVGTGAWSVISGPSTASTQFSSTTSNTATFTPAAGAGSYVLAWTISNAPCTASASNVTVTVTAAPTASVAGSAQTICATGTATLAANSPTVGTGAWSVVSGPSTASTQFSSTTSNTAVFDPAGGAGSYVLAWTISNAPCTASASNVTITVTAAPTASVAGTNQTICNGGAATLAANSPTVGTGAWSIVSGPSTSSTQFSSTTSNTATFTPAAGAGSYVLAWTISNAPCTASASNVTVTVTAAPTASVAGTNQTICASITATLAANSPTVGTGAWSITSGPSTSSAQFSSTTSNTAVFSPLGGTGTYILQWTISNTPCTASTSNVTITVTNGPSISVAGSNQTICESSTATLAANSPTVGSGSWSVVSGPSTASIQFSSTTDNAAVFSPVSAGSYILRWTITDASCTPSTDDITIIVNAAPTASVAGANQTICESSSATMSANIATVGTGMWSVVSGPSTSSTQFSSVSSNTAVFTPAAGAGTYILRWTISNAPCTDSDSDVSITVNPEPTAAMAGADQTICTSAIMAANSPGIGTGVWSVISGPSTSSAQFSSTTSNTATFTPAGGSGIYLLRWTISNAPCTASVSDVTITVSAPPTVSNAGTDMTGVSTCGSTSVTLAANSVSVGTAIWTELSGDGMGVFSDNTSETSTFSGTAGQAYTLSWTITSGACTSTSNVNVTFNIIPSAAVAGSDQTICSSNATLSGNAPAIGTGTWTLVSGSGVVTDPADPMSGITGLFAGTSTFRWTVSTGACESFDEMNIINGSVPSIDAGPDQIFCTGTTAVLNANVPSAGTAIWTVTAGGGTVDAPLSETSTVSGLVIGANTFEWTITDAGCTAIDAITITIEGMPTVAAAGTDQTICPTGGTTLAANEALSGTGTWSVTSGPDVSAAQFADVNDEASMFIPAGGPGAYVLTWTIGNVTCPSTSSDVTITVDAGGTVADAGTDQSITCVTTLAANTAAVGTGEWSIVSGPSTALTQFSDINSETATFTPDIGSGVYILRWTITSAPCVPTESDVTITVNCSVGIDAPQSESAVNIYPNPNNGAFEISVKGFANEEIVIAVVNSLGQKIRTEVVNGDQVLHVDLLDFGKGIYIIEVNSGADHIVKRIIVN